MDEAVDGVVDEVAFMGLQEILISRTISRVVIRGREAASKETDREVDIRAMDREVVGIQLGSSVRLRNTSNSNRLLRWLRRSLTELPPGRV